MYTCYLWCMHTEDAEINEPHCESQGCVCSPSMPCDESLCDGAIWDEGSAIAHCTMCQRELEEALAE